MKTIAFACFVLNTVLWATFYVVSKEALTRIDPFVYSALESGSTLPAAALILLIAWRGDRAVFTRPLVKRGVRLGAILAATVFTSTLALKHTTATNTAFFPSLNGVIAALIAWGVRSSRIKRATWIAGGISSAGALLLIFERAPQGGHWGGDLIALLAAFLYTCYIFSVDREVHREDLAPWPLFGVELVTMAALTALGSALFGDWSAVKPELPRDALVILYIGFGTTFLPSAIAIFMQRYTAPVTVAFIYIFEPVWSALLAWAYLGEALTPRGYLGGALLVFSALFHTWYEARAEGGRATPATAAA